MSSAARPWRAVGDRDDDGRLPGRRLTVFRGVIQAANIIRCEHGWVTFRNRDSASGSRKNTARTVNGAHFLWLVLQHILPNGLRRSRNFGLLHANCKYRRRLALLRMRLGPAAMPCCPASMQPSTQPPLSERPKLQCHCCGSAMVIVRRRIAPLESKDEGSMKTLAMPPKREQAADYEGRSGGATWCKEPGNGGADQGADGIGEEGKHEVPWFKEVHSSPKAQMRAMLTTLPATKPRTTARSNRRMRGTVRLPFWGLTPKSSRNALACCPAWTTR